MRKLKWLPVVFTSFFLLSSCMSYYNGDYPSHVYFPKEGGWKIIDGSDADGLVIWEGDKNYTSQELKDSENMEGLPGHRNFKVSSDWLTAEHSQGSNTITLYVKPNTTGKKRTAVLKAEHPDPPYNSPYKIHIKQDK